MGHLVIFICLAAFLLESGAALWVGRLRKTNPKPFLGPLFRFNLSFGLVVLTVFSTKYAETNLAIPYEQHSIPVVLWIFANNFGGFAALAGLLFNFPAVFRGFQSKPPAPGLKKALAAAVTVFAAGYIAGFVLILYRVDSPLLDASRTVFNLLCLLFLWGTALFYRLRPPVAVSPTVSSKSVRLFAGLYLAGFSLFLALLLLPAGQTMLFLALWLLVMSGIPLLWLRFNLRDKPLINGQTAVDPGVLEEIASAHSLSAREKDILRSLFEGRSNAEIGAALFISTGTVKNHVTNVFKKLGISRRSQLLGYLQRKSP